MINGKKIKTDADEQMKAKDTDFSHMLNQSLPSENSYTQVILH